MKNISYRLLLVRFAICDGLPGRQTADLLDFCRTRIPFATIKPSMVKIGAGGASGRWRSDSMWCESDKGWCRHSRAHVGQAQVQDDYFGVGYGSPANRYPSSSCQRPSSVSGAGGGGAREGYTGGLLTGQVCAPPLVLWGRLGLWMGLNNGHSLRDAMRTENLWTKTAMC